MNASEQQTRLFQLQILQFNASMVQHMLALIHVVKTHNLCSLLFVGGKSLSLRIHNDTHQTCIYIHYPSCVATLVFKSYSQNKQTGHM